MHLKKVSIVIPAYNEEKYIARTIEKVISSNVGSLDKEIIIVDDGSNDNTVKQINPYVNTRKNNHKTEVLLIQKNTNEGKGAALKIGFLKATGDIVIVQDADLEYSPDDYPNLIEPFLKQDVDAVYGSRFISDRPHRILYFWHYLANTGLTFFSNMLSNLNLTDMETGFKVFNGELIRKIAPSLKSKRFGFEPEITARIAKIPNIKLYEVGISYAGRTYADGKKIGWKDGMRTIWEIFKFNLFR